MQHVISFLSAYQDYVWFLSLLGWGATAFIWWRTCRRESSWGWLGASAVSGAAIALTELVMLATPVIPSPAVPAHLTGDLLLGLWTCLQLWGWSLAWLRTRLARGLAAIVVVEFILIYRRWLPEVSNVAVALALFILATLWWRRLARETTWARLALALACIASWGSSHGVLADMLGQSRRWMEVSHVGLGGAMLQLIASLLALFALREKTGSQWLPEQAAERARDLRWLIRWGAIWLCVGYGLATWSGRLAQRSFERSALTRVQAMAASLDLAQVEQSLGPDFRIENRSSYRQPSGLITEFGHSSFHASARCAPIRTALQRLTSQNPDARGIAIRTFREGKLLICLGVWPPGALTIERDITEQDQRDWRNRTTDFHGMVYTSFDEIAVARAPLLSPKGEMLGWLTFVLGVSDWIAAQTQARLQTFFVVALGMWLLALACAQRWRDREREAARRDAALAQASEKLKASFLAKVSHELRTPLQSILGYGELARSGSRQPEVTRHVGAILEHGQLLLRLVNDLIDLSAIQAGGLRLAPQVLAVPGALVQAAESLRPAAEAKGLTLTVRAAAEPHWVSADPERLRQIVLNLLGNAIKFTASGRVEVVVGCVKATEDNLVVSIHVRDTGPGIAPAHREELFRPFSRLATSARHEGSGLGLAITAGLCEQMRGTIDVESDGHSGSTFRATLTLPHTPAPASRQADPMAVLSRLTGRRILVADDNTLVRHLFAEHLSALGAECVVAADGAEALAHTEREVFFAAVLDLSMPELDGVSVARRIRAQSRGGSSPRLIAASAHSNAADRAVALAAGFDVYLVKPVRLADLTAALDGEANTTTPAIEPLRHRLRAMFLNEVQSQVAELTALVARRDWSAVRARTHYLKNSAQVIEDHALTGSLGRLEVAATSGDEMKLEAAWREAQMALKPWLAASQ